MASIPLVDTYKRYKAGTKRLVNWLATSVEILNTKSNHARISKKVTVADLIIYATRIVEARDPRIEIDVSILDVTKDAITGRALAATWYQELASETDSGGLHAANVSHRHFLNVL